MKQLPVAFGPRKAEVDSCIFGTTDREKWGNCRLLRSDRETARLKWTVHRNSLMQNDTNIRYESKYILLDVSQDFSWLKICRYVVSATAGSIVFIVKATSPAERGYRFMLSWQDFQAQGIRSFSLHCEDCGVTGWWAMRGSRLKKFLSYYCIVNECIWIIHFGRDMDHHWLT